MTSVDAISFNLKGKRSNLHGQTDFSPMSVKQETIYFHCSRCQGRQSESIWKPGWLSMGNPKLFFFWKGGSVPLMLYRLTHDQNNGLIHTNVLNRAGITDIQPGKNQTKIQHVPPIVCRLTLSLGTSCGCSFPRAEPAPHKAPAQPDVKFQCQGALPDAERHQKKAPGPCFSYPQEHIDPSQSLSSTALLCFSV